MNQSDLIFQFLEQRMQSHKKTFSLSELYETCGLDASPDDLQESVRTLVGKGVLEPYQNKNSSNPVFRLNGNLYNQEFVRELQREIHQEGISSKISMDYYFQNPRSKWMEDRTAVLKINAWLKSHPIITEMRSSQERAEDIFGDEKFLEGPAHRKILKNIGLKDDDLGIEGHPDPLGIIINNPHCLQKKQLVNFIVENKAPFFRLLKPISSFPVIDTLIFGSGWQSTKKAFDVPSLLNLQLHLPPDTEHSFLYWGDLDFEGIDIWHVFAGRIPSVRLAVPFYQQMLQHPPATGQKKGHRKPPQALRAFLSQFSSEEARSIEKLLKISYLPQECLSGEELLQCLKKTTDFLKA